MIDLRDTANRVRVALYLSIDHFDEILKKLEEARAKSVYLIEEVEKDLKELEDLQIKIAAELKSPNSALRKAAVLEFVEGERAKGMIIWQYNSVKKLGNTLGIKPNLSTIRDIANAMRFDLGDNSPSIFGSIQRN